MPQHVAHQTPLQVTPNRQGLHRHPRQVGALLQHQIGGVGVDIEPGEGRRLPRPGPFHLFPHLQGGGVKDGRQPLDHVVLHLDRQHRPVHLDDQPGLGGGQQEPGAVDDVPPGAAMESTLTMFRSAWRAHSAPTASWTNQSRIKSSARNPVKTKARTPNLHLDPAAPSRRFFVRSDRPRPPPDGAEPFLRRRRSDRTPGGKRPSAPVTAASPAAAPTAARGRRTGPPAGARPSRAPCCRPAPAPGF